VIPVNDILKDSVLLNQIMNKSNSNREPFFKAITLTSDPTYLMLFLNNKYINFRKYFLNNKDDNFIVESLQNCYMKHTESVQDAIIDFLEKYNADALHTLGLRLMNHDGPENHDPIDLMSRAALAPYPSIMANTRLAQMYEEIAQEQSSIQIKINILGEAIRFARRGDETSRMNIPKLEHEIGILVSQIKSASNGLLTHAWTGPKHIQLEAAGVHEKNASQNSHSRTSEPQPLNFQL
jgi:hypothetical protein